MTTLRLGFLLLLMCFAGEAVLGSAAVAAEASGKPQITAGRVALMLDRLQAPAASPIVRTAGSCTTSCGPGPEGNCSRSCENGQSCSTTCSGGKAVCRCE